MSVPPRSRLDPASRPDHQLGFPTKLMFSLCAREKGGKMEPVMAFLTVLWIPIHADLLPEKGLRLNYAKKAAFGV